MTDVFAALKHSDTELEINTAAIRTGLKEYYPRTEIINLARREGVAVRRLGSDAHRPEQIGFDFEAASALAPAFIAGCDD
jgi:histidinol-phosphatase (PHP family)